MKRCTVSMIGVDGKTQTMEVEAASAFGAAHHAMRCWSALWWYRPDAVIEVRAGDETWKVWAERVREWKPTKL
jgi:hypothetical protein